MIDEVNYNIHVYRGVDFRPEFQYIVRPNAQSTIRNAAAFGFKASVEFYTAKRPDRISTEIAGTDDDSPHGLAASS